MKLLVKTSDVKTDFLAKPVIVLCKSVFYRLPDYVTSHVEFGTISAPIPVLERNKCESLQRSFYVNYT